MGFFWLLMFLFSHSWKEVRVKQRNTVNEGINIVLGFHFVCFFCRLESQLWRSFRSRSRTAATDQKSAACVPSGRGGFVFLPVFSLLTSVKTSSLQEKTHCSPTLLRRFTSRGFLTSSACRYPCKNLFWFELHSGGFA